AGVPIAWLTAALALEGAAQLRRGERVLIHAATGGVGLAAVHLAQRAGAVVFATASTPEKQTLLRAYGVTHIFSSRTGDFAAAIQELTDGQGVDVVLNSLSGALIDASLAAIAPQGRFIELGKREVWTQEQVAALRPSVRYQLFDLSTTLHHNPSLLQH